MIGQSISGYRIVERLGDGGMGVVYKAEDPKLQRTVAIKLLAGERVDSDEAKARFVREARATASLDHPNICTVHDVGETADGQLFIVMACYDGGTLRDRMARGRLAVDDSLDLAIQIADGLAAAHAAGVIHRDIKPENLLFDAAGRLKIVDFGLAKAGTANLTRTGVIQGTVAYMSPEQALGDVVDARTDVWALGAVLYEMVTGRPPFRGGEGTTVIQALLHREPEPLFALVPDAPVDLQHVLDRALAKEPVGRYAGAREMAAELQRLRSGRSISAPIATSERPRSPSVAVLAFDDMSPDSDQEYFCDGIAEELINALNRLEGLIVPSRTSSFQFKGRGVDPRTIGQQLHVETVLEGSVRTAGENIRVTARLIKASDGYEIWSERFDRKVDDVFAVQDEIAARVVESLRQRLVGGTRIASASFRLPRPDNLEAYNAYLKGRYYWNRRSGPDLEKSVELFRRALRWEPEYAQAWAGLSAALVTLAVYGVEAPSEVMPEAREAAQKALAIVSDLSEAQAVLASVASLYDWQWAESEELFQRALELDPDSALARQWYATHCLAPQGRFDDALEQLQVASQLDPVSPAIGLSIATVLHYAGRLDDALAQIEATRELDSGSSLSGFFEGRIKADRRHFGDARRALVNVFERSGESSEVLAALAWSDALAGDETRAREELAELERRAASGWVSPVLRAQVLTALGDAQGALEALAEAVEGKATDLVWISVHPAFTALRGVGLEGVLERIGLSGMAGADTVFDDRRRPGEAAPDGEE